MSFSNYLEGALLDHMFNKATFTPLTTVYVALSTTDPGEDGSGITEPSGGGYARKAVLTTAFTRTGNVMANNAATSFSASTGAWLAGDVLDYFGLYDAASGGNFLVGAATSAPQRSVGAAGVVLEFGVGALAVSLD